MKRTAQTWIPLLLADPSPCLRLLVLRDLLYRPDEDEEVRELAAMREIDPLVTGLLTLQESDGSWGDMRLASRGGRLRSTSHALMRLGYLGFHQGFPGVDRGAEYLFSRQREDGSWPLPASGEGLHEYEGYSMVPLQTAMPLRGLAACGFATDPRAERAFDWLLAQRLPDGAWPTGTASGNYGYVAGYRRLSHSRWGCRSNTTGALICLAYHPRRSVEPQAQQALDLLLGRETREKHTLGFEIARLIGAEPTSGFLTYYARFDLVQVLDLCWRVGANLEDERVAEMVGFVEGLQGPYGLWAYTPCPQASRWVTFDLLRSLSRLGDINWADADREGAADWFSLEPRTPFQAYPRRVRRF